MSQQLKNYGAVKSLEQLVALVERLIADDKPIGFDIETGYDGPDADGVSLHPDDPRSKIVGFSFTNSLDWARYVPLTHDMGANLDPVEVAPILWRLCNSGLTIIHNCFSGDTQAITPDGPVALRDLVGREVELWTESGWVKAPVREYPPAELWEIEFAPSGRSRTSVRHVVRTTSNHRWQVSRRSPDRKVQGERVPGRREAVPGYVTTDQLRLRDCVPLQLPVIDPSEESDGFRHGLVFADGSLATRQPAQGFRHQMRMCGHKARFRHLWEGRYTYPPSAHGDPVVNSWVYNLNAKCLPPEGSSSQYLADFIHGWSTYDGTDHLTARGTRICQSTNRVAVDWLIEHAAQAGWAVTGVNEVRGGTGYVRKDGTVAALYNVTISKDQDLSWSVRSIRKTGVLEPVYCPEVPDIGRFALAPGIYTANSKFEVRHLARFFKEHAAAINTEWGIDVGDGYFIPLADSMLVWYIDGSHRSYALKGLTKIQFDHDQAELISLFPGLAKNKAKALRFNILDLTPEVVSYACEDALWCLALYLKKNAEVKGHILYRVEHALLPVICGMEDFGIRYDWGAMRTKAVECRRFLEKLEIEIQSELSEMVGRPTHINLGSPKQLANILYDELSMPVTFKSKKTGAPSTSELALRSLASKHPVVKKITEWREIKKLLGTYLDKYEREYSYAPDGMVHPNHMQTAVPAGRFAVSDSPYQQSPKYRKYELSDGTKFEYNFRDFIIAPPGHYQLGFDYSQVELRMLAGEAQEPTLLKAFEDGVDVHKVTASLLLGTPFDQVTPQQRSIGKTLNFGLQYGMGADSLAERLTISKEEGKKLYDQFFASYPAVRTWTERQKLLGKSRAAAGQIPYVESRFGRRIPIWELQSENPKIRSKGERLCVNAPIQGAAADYMKIAMVRQHQVLKEADLLDRVHLVMNIHDALEYYVDKSVRPEEVIRILQPAISFRLPGLPQIVADWHIGLKWGSLTELEVSGEGDDMVIRPKSKDRDPDPETVDPIEDFEDDDLDGVAPALPAPSVVAVVRSPQPTPVSQPVVPPREPVVSVDEARHVFVEITEMPTQDQYERWVEYLKENRGLNTVTLRTPEGELDLVGSYAIAPKDQPRVSMLLGGASVAYALEDVPVESVTAGLEF